MKRIEKTRGVFKGMHFCFTKEEAVERGIEWNSKWWEAETGEWTISDDGIVLKVLNIYVQTKNKVQSNYPHRIVKTAFGSWNGYKKAGAERPTSKMMMDNGEESPLERHSDLTNPNQRRRKAILQLIPRTGSVREAVKQISGTDNPLTIKRNVSFFLKGEGIAEEIGKAMSEYLKNNGIDEDWIVSQYKKMAQESESEKIKLEALDRLRELSGLMKKKSFGGDGFAGFTPEVMKSMKKTG